MRIGKIAFGFIVTLVSVTTSYGERFYGGMYASDYHVADDVYIDMRGGVYISDLYIDAALAFENRGLFQGNIHVADGMALSIKNSGTMDADFYLGTNSRLTQLITSSDDIKNLETDVDYSILVRNAEMLSLGDIVSIGGTSGRIILENSSLVIDSTIADTSLIQLIGNVKLYVNSLCDLANGILIDNIGGTGVATIIAPNDNPLMAIKTYIENDKLYVTTVRETDYRKILDSNTGNFLHSVRAASPHDRLLAAMDGASDIEALRGVMAKSVRLNPINLMNPVRVFDAFEMFNLNIENDFYIAPIVIKNAEANINAARMSYGVAFTNNFNVGVAGYAGMVDVSDDINDFVGSFVGANIGAKYDNGEFMARGIVGASFATFESDFVMDGAKTRSAPNGKSFYGQFDVGVHLNPDGDFVFTPFAGAGINRAVVAHQSDNKSNTGIGVDIDTHGGTDDLTYDYGLRMRAETSGDVGAALHIDAWSVFDAAGGGAEFGIITTDFGTMHRVSFNARFAF